MATKTDIRQFISRDTLARLTGTSGSQLDDIVRAINSEVTPPLALTASALVVTIGNIVVTNPDTNNNHTIPPISNVIPTFTAGTITASGTGTGTFTPSAGSAITLAMSASQFMRVGVNLAANGNITLTAGLPAASAALALYPATVSGLFAIGSVLLQTDGSNNIVAMTNGSCTQYAGGGGGSGSGSGNPTLETLKNELVDSPYGFVSPVIISTDGQSKLSTLTGATYDLTTNTIKWSADAQVAVSTNMLDVAEFLPQGLDVSSVDLSIFWNPGTSLQAFSIPDTAATYSALVATTVSGTTVVTVTTPINHGLVTGSKITSTTSTAIGGLTAGNLSVTASSITVLTPQKFSFIAGASASSSASGTLDTVAVLGFLYEVSRDGGNNYFTAPLSRVGTTQVFRTNLTFGTESTKVSQSVQATSDTSALLTNSIASGQFAQKITIGAGTGFVVQQVTFNMGASTGTPIGNLYVSIIKDANGSPSLAGADVLAVSNSVAASSITAGTNSWTIPNTVLTPGNYWVVLYGDAAYEAQVGPGINVLFKTTAPGFTFAVAAVPASPWTVVNNRAWYYQVLGRPLDLRLRITSAGAPTYPVGLDGFGIFYSLQNVGIVGATKKTQRFVFNSVTDNLSTFNISNFSADPDLLTCYWVEGGQVFKVPAFQLNGSSAVFPANTFNQNGVSQTITLVFDQNNGGAFDNSDANNRLMATNHLGSTNGSDDKSASGRGIILRNAAGQLVELAINANNQITITTVP